MLKRMLCGCWILLTLVPAALPQTIPTPGERNRYTAYTQHEEVVQFISELAHKSANLRVMEIGKTQALEDYPAQSLLLCILTAEGISQPQQLDRNKPTILITASQHGSEQSAKEAALVILRDIALGDLQPLLKKANILIIPQVNPWGNQHDRRVNELDLDMNRDHIKMETAGVQAIHRVFRVWMPEVTLDVHERGDDYYRVAMGCVSNANIDAAIQSFSRETILAEVEKALAKEKITFHEYWVTSENMPSDASGADFSDEELARWPQITRYSTSDLNDGRNSLGIYQTYSFIQEGASRHDLQTLADRTGYQSRALRAFLQSVAAHGAEMMTQVRTLRQKLLDRAATYSPDQVVHIKMEYRQDPAQPELRLLAFQKRDKAVAGVLKVDKKAGEKVLESELEPMPPLAQSKAVPRILKNWYPLVVPTQSVERPLGYVIPAKHMDVIATLRSHDVDIMMFERDCRVKLEGYLTAKVTPSKYDYVAPDTLVTKLQPLELLCKKGDFYIPCRQPAALLLPCLLEPESDYGLIRYWKYRLVPETDAYFCFYRNVSEENLPLVPYCDWPR